MDNLISIKNETLSVTLDTVGAVLHSIKSGSVEYLWQGDPKYWKRRDAILFPYVGRLTEGVYSYKGQRYELSTHGFCIGREFEVFNKTDNSVCFVLRDSEETRRVYPFSFELYIEYVLKDNCIVKTQTVKNLNDGEMIFGLGAHPGFRVPLDGEGEFTDWYFEFPRTCRPTRIGLDPENYRLSGVDTPFALENNTGIPLKHSLFDLDAIVLSDIPRSITLASEKSAHSVQVDFPGMGFLGLWHAPHTDAGYVCVEPWVSLPSHSAYVEELEKQEHLIHLPAGESYINVITTTIK